MKDAPRSENEKLGIFASIPSERSVTNMLPDFHSTRENLITSKS